jgi:putative nucleotidyltransferase with HDIG domain
MDAMITQTAKSPIKSLSDSWFELLLVTFILAVTLVAHHLVDAAPIMLHFFYLPVIVAAHYFGRFLACLTALFAFLAVVIFAILNPPAYMYALSSVLIMALTLCGWGSFLGLTALALGSLSDQRTAQMRELRQAHLGIIEILSKYLQAADHYTKSHSMRVADMAEGIANEMELYQAQIEDIRVGALLHDIGKVEISTRLIQKAAGLTEAEREEMQSHTVHGADLVRSLGTILEGAIPMITHHHDHYSESSKGEGSHGEDIPLGARIISVADAYDAIVTDRPYRRGRTPQEAIAIIQESSGKQFDPDVVEAFERMMNSRADEFESADAEQSAAQVPAEVTVR